MAASMCPIDACDAGTCTHSVVHGDGAAACAGQLVPRSIATRFARACRRAASAVVTTDVARAARLRRLAERALARTAGLAARAGQRHVSPACGAAIEAGVASARARLAATPLDRPHAP
jgi:hypothetical protein